MGVFIVSKQEDMGETYSQTNCEEVSNIWILAVSFCWDSLGSS